MIRAGGRGRARRAGFHDPAHPAARRPRAGRGSRPGRRPGRPGPSTMDGHRRTADRHALSTRDGRRPPGGRPGLGSCHGRPTNGRSAPSTKDGRCHRPGGRPGHASRHGRRPGRGLCPRAPDRRRRAIRGAATIGGHRSGGHRSGTAPVRPRDPRCGARRDPASSAGRHRHGARHCRDARLRHGHDRRSRPWTRRADRTAGPVAVRPRADPRPAAGVAARKVAPDRGRRGPDCARVPRRPPARYSPVHPSPGIMITRRSGTGSSDHESSHGVCSTPATDRRPRRSTAYRPCSSAPGSTVASTDSTRSLLR